MTASRKLSISDESPDSPLRIEWSKLGPHAPPPPVRRAKVRRFYPVQVLRRLFLRRLYGRGAAAMNASDQAAT